MTKDRDTWLKLIEENKKQWAKDLYELILAGRYWDINFDRYAKYRVFSIHFKKEIIKVLEKARDMFPEDEMQFEDVAHDLFLCVSEDMEVINKMSDDIDEITTELANMLPRA
tara:strand:- start:92 stop:427 length:336 start_codon:yes stop_codon:yes gene_type:complete